MAGPEECKKERTVSEAMQEIAKRRPGCKKLIYDRATRTIVAVDRRGTKESIGLNISTEDADMI